MLETNQAEEHTITATTTGNQLDVVQTRPPARTATTVFDLSQLTNTMNDLVQCRREADKLDHIIRRITIDSRLPHGAQLHAERSCIHDKWICSLILQSTQRVEVAFHMTEDVSRDFASRQLCSRRHCSRVFVCLLFLVLNDPKEP